ncbi:GNAT family N-acetyltransferase [Aurantiacibacter poecillastricola]|uniref:GNAT family N-acetyltransferase n=1 Tax=Aurantiacibacter poecillastricola TaxID=3064385 RepID=UPI00273E2954|nr:GNAT family N-acetyltransferase [Aurantiacibacter sp. 219JJ12-13]MDP5261589.1 GNAT family N-acetyltransferase [Aurantiacibacter sp. 219JJ12-13]
MSTIAYEQVDALDVDTFRQVLDASGLAARRPVDDAERLQRMLDNANLIVVARDGDRIVGVARSSTDFAHFCYLADLAVDKAWKGKGIGTRLIEETRQRAGPETMCLLLSAPDAEPFYDRIGMPRATNAFLYPRER